VLRVVTVTVLTVSSRALIQACERMGIDSDDLLARAEVSRELLDDPDGRLPSAKVGELWALAHAASDDVDLALHAAEALPHGAYKVIDFLSWNAPSVGAALSAVSAYFPLINATAQLPLRRIDGCVLLDIVAPNAPAPLSRPYVEYALAAVFLRVREATRGALTLRAIHFAFPPPASKAEHERIFACPVRFDARRSGLEIEQQVWDMPNEKADGSLFAVLADHATTLLHRLPQQPPEIVEAQRAIHEQLRGGDPALDNVARELAVSPRTLQRRLKKVGVTYADLLDRTREGAAKRYLDDRGIAICEVAFLLGFAEQSSFNRAFKRWTGRTPNAYRRRR
jgi:AraC-like DNA-binding protein